MNERPFQLAIHGRMSVDGLSTGRAARTDKAPRDIFAVEVQKMCDICRQRLSRMFGDSLVSS